MSWKNLKGSNPKMLRAGDVYSDAEFGTTIVDSVDAKDPGTLLLSWNRTASHTKGQGAKARRNQERIKPGSLFREKP